MNEGATELVLGRVQEATEFLGVKLVDVNKKGIFGSTPLHIVCFWGDTEAAQTLLASDADVNAVGDMERTPPFDAVSGGNLELVRLLLAAGADAMHKDHFSETALQVALTMNSSPQIAALLASAMK
jgi:ankyrin repeat protein